MSQAASAVTNVFAPVMGSAGVPPTPPTGLIAPAAPGESAGVNWVLVGTVAAVGVALILILRKK